MSYCFRYRFKLLSALAIEKAKPAEVAMPGFPDLTFELGSEAPPAGHWVIARLCGFSSEEEARAAGQRLGDALLFAGALTRMGIDIGFSRSTLSFSDANRARVREQTGKELRPDTHGLMVYEEDTVIPMKAEGHISAHISLDEWKERLSKGVAVSKAVTERQRTCAALLNDSLFVPHVESKFVLRISAVEALCDQSVRDARYRAAVEHLEQQLAGLTLDDDVRETLKRTLNHAKRQSLRQAYMAKFRSLCSADDAKAFDVLYGKRSTLVHDGLGRGELAEAADEALTLALRLLEADLANSTV